MSSFATIRKAFKYLPWRKSIMLKGVHGIGKTEFIRQLAFELGLKFVLWHASHAADAADITGMPQLVTETIEYKDPVTGELKTETHPVTKTAPPVWMIQREPVLLLLDEINRGIDLVLNALMQLTNDQTYDGIALPEGSRVVACVNPDNNGLYSVNGMDPAQISRFAVFEATPTTEEWIEYAISKKVHPSVISFIQANDRYLDPYTNEELVQSIHGVDCGKLPDRRAWFDVSNTIKNMEADTEWNSTNEDDVLLLGELVASLIGAGASYEFMEHYRDTDKTLNPRQILNMPEIPKDVLDKISDLAVTNQPMVIGFMHNCALMLESKGALYTEKDANSIRWTNNFVKIIYALPKETMTLVGTKVIYDAIQRKKPWATTACKITNEFKSIVRAARIIPTKVAPPNNPV